MRLRKMKATLSDGQVQGLVRHRRKFSANVHLGKGEWIAENVQNGSLGYDVGFIGETTEPVIVTGQKAMTLTIAESRRADGAPTEEVKRLFNSILVSGKVVLLTQMTQTIAERARDLHWDHGINLGGADAIHVATALTVGCSEFLTFDANKRIVHINTALS